MTRVREANLAAELLSTARDRFSSTLQDVCTGRVAAGAIGAFARAQRRRRHFLARALGKPSLPCLPPGALGVWRSRLPSVGVEVSSIGRAGSDLEPAMRVSWLGNNAGVVAAAGQYQCHFAAFLKVDLIDGPQR